jgi:hypothetical protein
MQPPQSAHHRGVPAVGDHVGDGLIEPVPAVLTQQRVHPKRWVVERSLVWLLRTAA